MIHAPLRGIFFLGRTAFVLAAAAAVPYLLKKNRRLAEQIGDNLIRAGENLKKGDSPNQAKAGNAAKPTGAKTSAGKPSPSKGAPSKAKPATKKRPAQSKPATRKPSARKKAPAKPAKPSTPTEGA